VGESLTRLGRRMRLPTVSSITGRIPGAGNGAMTSRVSAHFQATEDCIVELTHARA
jgi:hypothetical protein